MTKDEIIEHMVDAILTMTEQLKHTQSFANKQDERILKLEEEHAKILFFLETALDQSERTYH